MSTNLSTGPRTPEGKAKSSKNATKHGLLAGHLLPIENPEAFAQLRDIYFSQYPPRDVWEFDLLEEIVWAKWLKLRCRNNEKAILTLLADPKSPDVDPAYAPIARAFIQNAGAEGVLGLLNRYATRINREYLRHLREFQRLRPEAFAALASPPPNGAARVSERQAPAQSPEGQPDTPKFPNELPQIAAPSNGTHESITQHPEWPAIKDLVYETISPHPEMVRIFLAKLDERIAQQAQS